MIDSPTVMMTAAVIAVVRRPLRTWVAIVVRDRGLPIVAIVTNIAVPEKKVADSRVAVRRSVRR